MTVQGWLALLNRARAICLFERPLDIESCGQIPTTVDEPTIYILHTQKSDLDGIISELHQQESSIADTYSLERFRELLIVKIRGWKEVVGELRLEEARAFREELLQVELTEFRVLRDVMGISFLKGQEPFPLGPFTIYNREEHHEIAFKSVLRIPSSGLEAPKSNFLIECRVLARDPEKAQDKADRLFRTFELLMWVAIGRRNKNYLVGVVTYTKPRQADRWVISEGHVVVGYAWEGPLHTIDLDDSYFNEILPSFKRLFGLAGNRNNNLETKVLRSAEWLGQALADQNEASAFVKAAIALEVLFIQDQKGPVTSSIMAQISESCAHILGKGMAHRLRIEKEVKKLYGIRSAVVHSGVDQVSGRDLDRFIQLGRSVLLTLLQDSRFSEVTSNQELANFLKTRKYNY